MTAPLTLRDIASAAGVSIAAVSQALNNTGSLHPDTRARIQSIAAERGYVPNKVAAALRRRKTMSIGFVANTEHSAESRHWASVSGAQLNALVVSAAEQGFTVTVIPHDRPELVAASQVDALYLTEARLGRQVLAEAIARGLPVVTTDVELPYDRAIRVHTGYAEATVAALDALAAAGSLRPALLAGDVYGAAVGEQAYLDWCAERGVEPMVARGSSDQDHLVSQLHELVRGGADAMFSLVEQGPALYIGLERDGVILPRDMQLIALCVDECHVNERLDISHICVHPELTPSLVLPALIESINTGTDSGAASGPTDITLPWHYYAGATTRPARSAA